MRIANEGVSCVSVPFFQLKIDQRSGYLFDAEQLIVYLILPVRSPILQDKEAVVNFTVDCRNTIGGCGLFSCFIDSFVLRKTVMSWYP